MRNKQTNKQTTKQRNKETKTRKQIPNTLPLLLKTSLIFKIPLSLISFPSNLRVVKEGRRDTALAIL